MKWKFTVKYLFSLRTWCLKHPNTLYTKISVISNINRIMGKFGFRNIYWYLELKSASASTQSCQNPLRKHAYSNIKKILHPKSEIIWNINPDIFLISAQNIDCGCSLEPPRRGGSNEYPQSMFLSRNKKNNVCPCKPQFYYIKVGF